VVSIVRNVSKSEVTIVPALVVSTSAVLADLADADAAGPVVCVVLAGAMSMSSPGLRA